MASELASEPLEAAVPLRRQQLIADEIMFPGTTQHPIAMQPGRIYLVSENPGRSTSFRWIRLRRNRPWPS